MNLLQQTELLATPPSLPPYLPPTATHHLYPSLSLHLSLLLSDLFETTVHPELFTSSTQEE